MFQNLNIRWSIIIAFVIGAIYFIIPTYEYYSIINDPELNDLDVDYLREDALKLGLDLQGGLYIILELDYKPYLLQQSNQSQSTQSKNSLVGLINETLSASLQNQTDVLDQLLATSQKNNIDLVNYYSNVLKINPGSSKDNIIDILKANRTESITSILEVMRNRIESHNKYGVGEPTIQQFGSDRLIIELAGVSDVSNAKEYIQRTAEFELSLVYDLQKFNDVLLSIDKGAKNEIKLQNILSPSRGSMLALDKNYNIINSILEKSESVFSDRYQILWDNNLESTTSGDIYRRLYLVSSKSAISGGQVKDPKALISEFGNEDAGRWIVNLDMTKEGKIKWSRFTGNNIGNRVAIVLDKKVFMAPTIQSKISSGGTRITGFSNKQEAQDIAAVLKAGELPAPINVAQINYIGPSLGEDSISSGWLSMFIGLIGVFIFMIIYYNLSGLIANVALLINMLLVVGILVTMQAVLTLPGIAGLLLTIGMSVDANIIIFERIREELRTGSKVKSAINNGYNRAFITILDANVTTLLTAFVLSFIGSGPIKGFATTLSVGILCSMFAAIFITRTMFMTLIKYKSIKTLSI